MNLDLIDLVNTGAATAGSMSGMHVSVCTAKDSTELSINMPQRSVSLSTGERRNQMLFVFRSFDFIDVGPDMLCRSFGDTDMASL